MSPTDSTEEQLIEFRRHAEAILGALTIAVNSMNDPADRKHTSADALEIIIEAITFYRALGDAGWPHESRPGQPPRLLPQGGD